MAIDTSLTLQAPPESTPILLPGDALAKGDRGEPLLIGGRCTSCGERMFPRHPVCPSCMGEDIVSETMPRRGTLYSYSVVHVGPKKWNKPFALGYVDLANSLRVFSHLLLADLEIGSAMELDVAEVGRESDGTPIVSFVFKRVEA
ncbi:MAG: hypothetical protein JWL84_165 [Rhodospirillales bacterium]|nr:hypothetical protein [Rhodospirillales bacterium]